MISLSLLVVLYLGSKTGFASPHEVLRKTSSTPVTLSTMAFIPEKDLDLSGGGCSKNAYTVKELPADFLHPWKTRLSRFGIPFPTLNSGTGGAYRSIDFSAQCKDPSRLLAAAIEAPGRLLPVRVTYRHERTTEITYNPGDVFTEDPPIWTCGIERRTWVEIQFFDKEGAPLKKHDPPHPAEPAVYHYVQGIEEMYDIKLAPISRQDCLKFTAQHWVTGTGPVEVD